MGTDEDGKRRLDLANETMAHHIVNMGAEGAEEVDSRGGDSTQVVRLKQ